MPAVPGSTSKHLTNAGWDDVPHLDATTKAQLLASTPPHLRDARSKGIPALGSGAIYPVAESEFVIDPMPIPDYFKRCYGLDVGWNRTAGIWAAIDPASDTVYLYSEHYRGQAEPSVHAAAIKARGEWIPGAIDPAANGRSQADGTQLLSLYRQLGLTLTPADNTVEAGLYDVWQRLSEGRLKVFSSLKHWLAEYRFYRRDERGRIVKEHDHLMDATRYAIRTGLGLARLKPVRALNSDPIIADPIGGY